MRAAARLVGLDVEGAPDLGTDLAPALGHIGGARGFHPERAHRRARQARVDRVGLAGADHVAQHRPEGGEIRRRCGPDRDPPRSAFMAAPVRR